MKHRMQYTTIIALTLALCSRAAWSQQPDTMATCGFSRIDFSQMHPWFNPANAHTTRTTALRARPAAGGKLLEMIAAGKPVYVVSVSPRTAWYHAIDPATGKVGWIYNEALEPEDERYIDSTTASPDYDGPLRQKGCDQPVKSDRGHARLRIVNHYAVPLKLLIDNRTYSVPRAIPGKPTVLQVTVKSGRQGYVIVVPDAEEIVDVFFGYADLQAANCYEYDVEVQSIE